MQRVGVAGLGIMGAAMARNLAKAGFGLAVWNRSPERAAPFADDGVPVVGTPADLAAEVDAVLIMVTGPEALAQVVGGEDGLASADLSGKVVVNASTVSPEATEDAAARVQAAGGAFLDAPVSGTKKPAEDGTLVFLAGGEAEVRERSRPMLEAMGKLVVDCGGIGDGTRMKLAINLVLANAMQALSEAMVMVRRMELDPERFLEAIGAGAVAAPMFQGKGRAILERAFAPQFPLEHAFKDLNLVLSEAGRLGAALPATGAVRETFSAAQAQGYGLEDIGALFKVVEALSGLDRKK